MTVFSLSLLYGPSNKEEICSRWSCLLRRLRSHSGTIGVPRFMSPRRSRPPRSGALTDLPPLKIIKKIVLLQLSFYACATSLILFTCLVTGTAFSPSLIFSWDSLRGDTTVGWLLGLVWMLNSFLRWVYINAVDIMTLCNAALKWWFRRVFLFPLSSLCLW